MVAFGCRPAPLRRAGKGLTFAPSGEEPPTRHRDTRTPERYAMTPSLALPDTLHSAAYWPSAAKSVRPFCTAC
jgi:hypothetical protein